MRGPTEKKTVLKYTNSWTYFSLYMGSIENKNKEKCHFTLTCGRLQVKIWESECDNAAVGDANNIQAIQRNRMVVRVIWWRNNTSVSGKRLTATWKWKDENMKTRKASACHCWLLHVNRYTLNWCKTTQSVQTINWSHSGIRMKPITDWQNVVTSKIIPPQKMTSKK